MSLQESPAGRPEGRSSKVHRRRWRVEPAGGGMYGREPEGCEGVRLKVEVGGRRQRLAARKLADSSLWCKK